jgi:hypothetical protein
MSEVNWYKYVEVYQKHLDYPSDYYIYAFSLLIDETKRWDRRKFWIAAVLHVNLTHRRTRRPRARSA